MLLPPRALRPPGRAFLRRAGGVMTAFTLVELLVVVAILVVLLVIAVPVASRSIEMTRLSKCSGNLRQIGIYFHTYLADHSGVFPPYEDLPAPLTERLWGQKVMGAAMGEPLVFRCPSHKEWQSRRSDSNYYYWFAAGGASPSISYGYNAEWLFPNSSKKGVRLNQITRPSEVLLMGERTGAILHRATNDATSARQAGMGRHQEGANFLFVDGHVKFFAPVWSGGTWKSPINGDGDPAYATRYWNPHWVQP